MPPNNKPNSFEIKKCNVFLSSEINKMKNLRIILTLGQISHNSTIIALNKNLSKCKFKHLKKHKINDQIILINCYHCSKYNINTKRLKISNLDKIFKLIKNYCTFKSLCFDLSQSLFFIVSLLSTCFLPLAKPKLTLTIPFLLK